MHPIIKQAADDSNLRSLKNIFVNALDEDPTFENYQEEFEYVKALGLLEPHRELTPFLEDPSRWTMDYWLQLEADLAENFSEQRMEHMKRVAKVFLKEKIAKIRAERSGQLQKPVVEPAARDAVAAETAPFHSFRQGNARSASEEQQREIEAERRRIAEHNREVEERQREQHRRAAQRREALERQAAQREEPSSKKASGIAIAAAVAVLLVIVLVMMLAK